MASKRRCAAHVGAASRYAKPGPCAYKAGVQVVRWAPTPLTTRVVPLCGIHRAALNRGARVLLADGTTL